MNKINKPTSFVKRNYYYLFGAFWFAAGIAMVFLENKWLGLGYAGMGVVALFYGFKNKDIKDEYIAWDEQMIKVKQMYNVPLTYVREKIDQIRVSDTDLTIKSGAANGIMVELKEYSPADILLLKKEMENYLSLGNDQN